MHINCSNGRVERLGNADTKVLSSLCNRFPHDKPRLSILEVRSGRYCVIVMNIACTKLKQDRQRGLFSINVLSPPPPSPRPSLSRL